ncbi:MAG: SIMPL domain-containing protein [Pirellulales bacterium]|nr:SIMPL domain-containing protein [Pirellulales bacterium]
MLCRLLTFALLLSLPAPLLWADHHEAEKPPRTITVAGEGKVKTKPDTASISAGVVTEADTAREALDKNTERMQQVMQGLLEAGISQDDLQTSQFSVSPVYSRLSRKAGAPRVDPKIVSYRVTNTATAIIRDLTKIGGVLDKVIKLGANSVSGPSFFVDKPGPLLDEAREKAVADALRKARLLAKAAEVKLGAIQTIREGGGYAPQPRRMNRAMAMDMEAKSVPIAAGSQEIRATVNIVLTIE